MPHFCDVLVVRDQGLVLCDLFAYDFVCRRKVLFADLVLRQKIQKHKNQNTCDDQERKANGDHDQKRLRFDRKVGKNVILQHKNGDGGKQKERDQQVVFFCRRGNGAFLFDADPCDERKHEGFGEKRDL